MTRFAQNAIPQIGFGLWKLPQERCSDLVYEAIKIGYRHFDSASDYGNEKEVGVGINKAISDGLCKREELWVTSKLWNTDHAPEHVPQALNKSLNDLQLDYLDLYLIHFPIALRHVENSHRYPAGWIFDAEAESPSMESAKVPLHKTWAAMEALQSEGLVDRIGVCNYGTSLLHDLIRYADIAPAMLQIESHPYLTQEKLLRLCHDYGIAVTAFSPFGSLSYVELDMAQDSESILERQEVKRIAAHHQISAAQVVLRWGIQRGTAVIPKSANLKRMKENLDVLNFSLSEDEMQLISSLNQNRRFNDPGVFCEAAFNTFYPIYD